MLQLDVLVTWLKEKIMSISCTFFFLLRSFKFGHKKHAASEQMEWFALPFLSICFAMQFHCKRLQHIERLFFFHFAFSPSPTRQCFNVAIDCAFASLIAYVVAICKYQHRLNFGNCLDAEPLLPGHETAFFRKIIALLFGEKMANLSRYEHDHKCNRNKLKPETSTVTGEG